jgi:hypothetical protein
MLSPGEAARYGVAVSKLPGSTRWLIGAEGLPFHDLRHTNNTFAAEINSCWQSERATPDRRALTC